MGPTKGPRSLSQYLHHQDRLPGVPDQPDLPPGFDAALHPILAVHWFGVHPHGVSALWWSLTRQGVDLPAEPGIILLDGGRS
jgi:hypothetical protein